jgi:heme/copper-type cytochrome/quinol oxidase subunit 1
MRIFSTDHKVIGLRYAITSLVFLLIGFLFTLLIRRTGRVAYAA